MTAPLIPEDEVRSCLEAAHVAIVGCGGLGSNVAAMLVRSGVATLTLIDFDTVVESNLNRQLFFRDQLGQLKTEALAETLRRIVPEARLMLRSVCVTAETLVGLVSDADVVVEAVDSAEAKAMIVDTCTRELPDMPLVTASGLAGYESANLVSSEVLGEHVWVVGDLSSDVREGHALFASRVTVAAAHQAHAVVRMLLGFSEP